MMRANDDNAVSQNAGWSMSGASSMVSTEIVGITFGIYLISCRSNFDTSAQFLQPKTVRIPLIERTFCCLYIPYQE